jgi:hypothetical protein
VRPRSSPDPLDTLDGASHWSADNQHLSLHPFDEPMDPPGMPADGPSTLQLRQKLTGKKRTRKDDSEVESIQSADGFDDEVTPLEEPSRKLAVPTAKVQEIIAKFQGPSANKVPFLDLSKQKPKIHAGMKGKQPTNVDKPMPLFELPWSSSHFSRRVYNPLYAPIRKTRLPLQRRPFPENHLNLIRYLSRRGILGSNAFRMTTIWKTHRTSSNCKARASLLSSMGRGGSHRYTR